MTLPPWFHYPESPTFRARRAAIIGAGLAGTSVAVALAKRGWEVMLIERQPDLSMEASGNPSGVVMPALSRDFSAASQFSYAAFQFALEHFRQLERHSDTPFFHSIGVLQLGDAAHSYQNAIDQHYTALRARILRDDELTATAGLRADVDALHFPTAGWANPRGLARAQIDSQPGRIRLLTTREVIHLQRRSGGWSLFDKGEELAETPVVIVANGTDVNRFSCTSPIAIVPARGQISFISANAFDQPVTQVICSNKGYVIPDGGQSFSIGATYERGSMNRNVTHYSHRENLRNLHALKLVVDANPEFILGGRAAIRTTTTDHLPLLGGVPDFERYEKTYHDLYHGKSVKKYPLAAYHEGLYVSAGFGSRGITHCPYSGELLARLITGEVSDAERKLLALLHPGRFVVRRLRKNLPDKRRYLSDTSL